MRELGSFRASLAQTITWCAGRELVPDPSNPSNSLRTPELSPDLFAHAETAEERQEQVDDLVEKRLKLLRWQGKYRILPARDLAGGRLLLYDPAQNPWDSAGFVESFGFFDWDNLPPWDTWVAYVRDREREREARKGGGESVPYTSYLVAWVPPDLIERADAGIKANPPECATWADELDTPLARRLNNLGAGERGWLPQTYRRLTSRLVAGRRNAPER